MAKDTFDQLIELIPKALFPERVKITRELRIEEDLSIYGDDAVDFIEKYSVRFNVDISNLDFGKYFTKETSFYFFKKILNTKSKQSLTLGDLERAIELGKLE